MITDDLGLAPHGIEGQVIGYIRGVLGDIELGAVFVRRAVTNEVTLVPFVVIVAVLGECVALVLVARIGEFEDVAVVDVPVQFAVPARILVGVFVVSTGVGIEHAFAVGGDLLFLPLEFAGQEKEQGILDQRAADVRRSGPRPCLVFVVLVEQLAGIVAVLVIGIGIAFSRPFGLPQYLPAEMPIVVTALADLVDDTAGGMAIGCAVTTGEDFQLIDRAVGKLQITDVGQRVGDIVTVDVIGVLGYRAAAERRHVAITGVTQDHARCQRGGRCDIARQRHAAQLLRSEYRTRIQCGRVDGWQAARCHGDAFERPCLRAGKRDIRSLTDPNVDVVAASHFAAVLLQRDRITAQRQCGH